jgi:hypothetical protein
VVDCVAVSVLRTDSSVVDERLSVRSVVRVGSPSPVPADGSLAGRLPHPALTTRSATARRQYVRLLEGIVAQLYTGEK